MTLELITKLIILAWPGFVVLALLHAFFGPDGRQDDHWFNKLGAGLWGCIPLWGLPVVMALSIPYKGDVQKIEFWDSVLSTFSQAYQGLSTTIAVSAAAGYVAIGLTWAVVHFWLYARRLGQKYVMERDLWLAKNNLKSLESLPPELRSDFTNAVLQRVKRMMFYEGDFPLRPLQQKRFFGANLVLWPATLVYYLIGDFALDVARRVWFAFRKRIHAYWAKGMAEYLADQAIVEECLEIQRKRREEEEAEREKENMAKNAKRMLNALGRGNLTIE